MKSLSNYNDAMIEIMTKAAENGITDMARAITLFGGLTMSLLEVTDETFRVAMKYINSLEISIDHKKYTVGEVLAESRRREYLKEMDDLALEDLALEKRGEIIELVRERDSLEVQLDEIEEEQERRVALKAMDELEQREDCGQPDFEGAQDAR